MGNSAVIQLVKGEECSPALYIHWHGDQAEEIIRNTEYQLGSLAHNPDSGLDCAFARLVENACDYNEGGATGFRVYNSPDLITEADCPIDEGCFIVDIATNEC